jgi:hypothetical protein
MGTLNITTDTTHMFLTELIILTVTVTTELMIGTRMFGVHFLSMFMFTGFFIQQLDTTMVTG